MKAKTRWLRSALALLLCASILMNIVPVSAADGKHRQPYGEPFGEPVLPIGEPEAPNNLILTDSNGVVTEEHGDDWDEKYPYGAFAFENSSLSAKEGETAVVKVFRVGGTRGRATAFITYQPLVVENEGEPVFSYGISSDDIVISVEQPQPIARYQALGKPAEPTPSDAVIFMIPETDPETGEAGYALTPAASGAESYAWQAKMDGEWQDVHDANEAQLHVGEEHIAAYDYRCIYTVGDTRYCTMSLNGEVFVPQPEEILEPMPADIELNAAPTYEALDLHSMGHHDAWIFELTFADGEWVKEIHLDALTDGLPEAEEIGNFTIWKCWGGDILEEAQLMSFRIEDIDEALPSTLGFAVESVTVDKAAGFAEVMVSRIGGDTTPVTIHYSTVDGTAQAGRDYAAAEGTLFFYTGLSEMPIRVELVDDRTENWDPLTFTIQLDTLLGDDDCTLTQSTIEVSLVNSGTGTQTNNATLLYDPGAVDLTAQVVDSNTAASRGVDTVTPEAQAPECAEPAYAELTPAEPEMSTQVYTRPNKTTTFDISFTNPSSGAWSSTASVTSLPISNWDVSDTGTLVKATTKVSDVGFWKPNSDESVTVNEGIALYSKEDPDATLTGDGWKALGGPQSNAGEMYSGYDASIRVYMGHDTSYLDGGTYKYSFTLPRLEIEQDGTTILKRPITIKRYGASPLDALWHIGAADMDDPSEKNAHNPHPGKDEWASYSKSNAFAMNKSVDIVLSMDYNSYSDHQHDKLNDNSMIWLKNLDLTRRKFAANAFKVEIVTPNDLDTANGYTVMTDDITYGEDGKNFKPAVSITSGGVASNAVYVGSTIQITAGYVPPGYILDGVMVYQSTDGGKNWKTFNKFMVNRDKNTFTIPLISWRSAFSTEGQGEALTATDLAAQYKFSLLYNRKSTVKVIFDPSVPRQADGKSLDTSRANAPLLGYNDPSDEKLNHSFTTGDGVTDTVTYKRSDMAMGYDTVMKEFTLFGNNKFSIQVGYNPYVNNSIADGSIKKPSQYTSGTETGAQYYWQFEVVNLQSINFGLSPKDLLLVNDKAYTGDQTIQLTESDLSGGLTVRYFQQAFQSAENEMAISIESIALYWDKNNNGQIDGTFAGGVFSLADDTDEFAGYLEPGEFYENVFTPKKNEKGEYCPYFFKVIYTMTPKYLDPPEGGDASKDFAQVLPSFVTSLNQGEGGYSTATDEQKAYKYIITGKDANGNYTADSHPMYGAAASAKTMLDIPLGGDRSPAVINGEEVTWTPNFQGNLLYPYTRPTPISIKESPVGTIEIAKSTQKDGRVSYTAEELSKINGYLGSFAGTTTFALTSQDQRGTTDEILADSSLNVIPDSVSLSGVKTAPDPTYLENAGPAGTTGGGMDSSGSGGDMEEFDMDMGINMGDMELAVSDYVTLLFDDKSVGFSIGFPLTEKKAGEAQSSAGQTNQEQWDAFKSFFDKQTYSKEGWGDESYQNANRDVAPDYNATGVEFTLSVTLAIMFEYNPLDNGFYFQGFTVALEGELELKAQHRFTPCPLLYIYVQLNVAVGVSLGMGVNRVTVEEKTPILNAKTSATRDNAIKLTYRTQPGDYMVLLSQSRYNEELEDFKKAKKSSSKTYDEAKATAEFANKYDTKTINGRTYYLLKDNDLSFDEVKTIYLQMEGFYLNADQYNLLESAQKSDYNLDSGYYVYKTYANLAAAREAFLNTSSYTFETEYKAFNVRFNGKLGIQAYKYDSKEDEWVEDDDCISGYLTSDGSADTTVILREQDGMKLDHKVRIRLRALDEDAKSATDTTTIMYLARVTDVEADCYFNGIHLEPELGLEIGAGIGVEIMKAEIYIKINLGCAFTFAVYNENYDPKDDRTDNDDKYEAFSFDEFSLYAGIGVRVVLLLFTFELDAVGYSVDYEKGEGWSHGWHFLNDWVEQASEEGYLGVHIRAPESKADTQRLYTAADYENDAYSTQAYNPVDTRVPFQLSGFGSSVDAVKLGDNLISGTDYRLVSAGDRNFLVYPISRASGAPEDTTQLVMSEIKAVKDVYGLANPVDETATVPYIVLDINAAGAADDTGDLDFNVWTDETGDTYTVNAVWVSYATQALNATLPTEPAMPVYTYTDDQGETQMTADNYKTIPAPVPEDPMYASYAAWFVYYTSLSSYNAYAQNRAAAAAKNTVVKTASWSFTRTTTLDGDDAEVVTDTADASFAPAQTVYGDGAVGKVNYLFTPAGGNGILFFGSTAALDTDNAAYDAYAAYLEAEGKAELLQDYRRSLKKSQLDVFGTQSALNAATYTPEGWKVAAINLNPGQTLENIEFTQIGSLYYVVYTTAQDLYDNGDYFVEKRMHLRTVDPSNEANPYGTAYILRIVRDYNDANERDGRYDSAGNMLSAHEGPYFANLRFLEGNLDATTLTGGELFSTQAVSRQTFLLFEMNAATYIIPESDLTGIGMGVGGTVYPFYVGREVEVKETDAQGYSTGVSHTRQEASGKQGVTIGTDADGNIYALYIGEEIGTTNNALYISAYDPDSNSWGEGVILAMNNMDVYEAAAENNWDAATREAAYLGLEEQKNTRGRTGLLSKDDLTALYGLTQGTEIYTELSRVGGNSLGDSTNFTFSNLQAVQSTDSKLLIVTQGQLTSLVKKPSEGALRFVPEYDAGSMKVTNGIYAIGFSSGEQSLDLGSIEFFRKDFTVGSQLAVDISVTNTGNTAFRGSPNQPITVTLSVSGQTLCTWTYDDNIKSGQAIQLKGVTEYLNKNLGIGGPDNKDSFVVTVSEDPNYGGTTASTVVYTVEALPDLSVENLTTKPIQVLSDGAYTEIAIDFTAANRGTAGTNNAYAQFSWGKKDAEGQTVYKKLDLTACDLTVGEETLLSTQELSNNPANGILALGSLGAGYGRRVTGKLLVPSDMFCGGESDYFDLRIEMFSDDDTITYFDDGALTGVHAENYTDNNASTESVDAFTTFNTASSLVIPLGTTTLVPLTAISSRNTEPVIYVEENREEDGANDDGQNLAVLNYKKSSASGGKTQGVLSISPSRAGSGIINVWDSDTGSVKAIAFIVTEAGEGIDIYIDNSYFTFKESNGDPYDPNNIASGWTFNGVSSWGSGSTQEVPLRGNVSVGRNGAYFTFDTVAESIDLYFQGSILVTTTNDFVGSKTYTGEGGNKPVTVDLGKNSSATPITHTVTVVVSSTSATFDRMEESYADKIVPIPAYDTVQPNLYWSRSFPDTASIDTANTTGIPLKLYALDNSGLSAITIDNITFTPLDAAVTRLDGPANEADGRLWVYDFGNITRDYTYEIAVTDNAGNITRETLVVDWFSSNVIGDTGTIEVPDYDAGFYQNNDAVAPDAVIIDPTGLRIAVTEAEGNPKAENNTLDVERIDAEGGFQVIAPSETDAFSFPIDENGVYWVMVSNEDKTWSRELMYMDAVDQDEPEVTLTYDNQRLSYTAKKDVGTRSPITSVKINGYSMNKSGYDISDSVYISRNGLYTLEVTDSVGHKVTETVDVRDPELALRLERNPLTEVVGNDILVNMYYVEGGVYDPNGIERYHPLAYSSVYEVVCVPFGEYDPSTINEIANWDRAAGGIHLINGLAEGYYMVIVRDANDTDSRIESKVAVGNPAGQVRATAINARSTYTKDGSVQISIAPGFDDIGLYQYALLPVDSEITDPTIDNLLDASADDPNGIPWTYAGFRNEAAVSDLAPGYYLVAVRPLTFDAEWRTDELKDEYQYLTRKIEGIPEDGVQRNIDRFDEGVENNYIPDNDDTYYYDRDYNGSARWQNLLYQCVQVGADNTAYTVTVETDGGGGAGASSTEAVIGEPVTLTATPAANYQFKEWQVVSGSVTITDGKFTMPAENVTIKAIFEADTFTVTVENDGHGTAEASAQTAAAGTPVTLTATPAANYHFKEWQVVSGDVTITDGKFTMPAENVTVKAIFEVDTFTVTVENDGHGTAEASDQAAEAGAEISLTATPAANYHFKEWQVVSGSVTITDGKFTMPAGNVTVKAIFEADTFTVTVENDGHGTAKASAQTAAAGAEITLTATPAANYHFKEWQVVSGSVTIKDGKFTMPAENVTVKAIFGKDSAVLKEITVLKNPTKTEYMEDEAFDPAGMIIQASYSDGDSAQISGYTVTPEKLTPDDKAVTVRYTENGVEKTVTVPVNVVPACTVSFEANGGSGSMEPITRIYGTYTLPANGFTAPKDAKFLGWAYKADGEVISSAAIEVKQNVTLYAVWGNKPVVTVETDGHGKASAAPSVADAGTPVKLTAKPDEGYRFKAWEVVSGGVTVQNDQFTMPDGNVRVKALFEAIPYKVTVEAAEHGTGRASAATATIGKTITLTAIPEKGYHFKGWEVTSGGVTITANSFTMPAADVTVKPVFEAILYTVTAETDGHGTAKASQATAAVGTGITLTATPEKGYRFKGWQVVSGGVTITDNSFTMPAANVTVKAIFEAQSYALTVQPTANGTVKALSTEAAFGSPVTLQVTPNRDYELKSLTVTDAQGQNIPVTGSNGRYVFTMPASPVTIQAEFVKAKQNDSSQTPVVLQPTEYAAPDNQRTPERQYSVELVPSEHGRVRVEPAQADAGSTVALLPMPDGGYTLAELTVTDSTGSQVPITGKNGLLSFTMPHGDVRVKAVFRPDAPAENPFSDVLPSNYYYDAVLWAVENRITFGITETTFVPNAACTRGQMVTFLWRANGSPEPEGTELPFQDVNANAYYAKAVCWAYENGIAKGTTPTTFSPNATVTRAQTVTFLYRLAGSPGGGSHPFTDVPADAYYADAVAWAYSQGIAQGTSATTFSPNAECSRGQIVTFLYRMKQR